MDYQVRVTDEARQDFAEYLAFICGQTNYVDNAINWFSGLENLIDSLAWMPARFPRAQDFLEHPLQIHHTFHHAHRLLFSIHEKEGIVRVLRLLHTRRDPAKPVHLEDAQGE